VPVGADLDAHRADGGTAPLDGVVGGVDQMIKSSDQSTDTRNRLLEAALDCFSERGFAGTTTRLICGRAGVNLALLNYHFGSKEALWAQVLRVLNDRLVAIATRAVCPATELGDGVAAFLGSVARELFADPRPMRVMAWAQMQPDGFDRAVVEAAYAPVVRAGVAYLEAEQAAGHIPPEVDVGLALVTFYGLLAEPLVEPQVHRTVFGADASDPAHAARLERHIVASGLRLLGIPGRST
jgi:AcrR family transcriptional regulator